MNRDNNIKKQIEKNNPICTLNRVHYNQENLKYLLEKLKQNKNISLLKWNLKESIDYNLEQEIQNELIRHNENYSFYPNDYIHCLLCSHSISSQFESFNSDYQLLIDQKWKIKQVFSYLKFKSILYHNHLTKNVVLTFHNFDPNQQLSDQIQHVYNTVKQVTSMCKRKKYNLSFTGFNLTGLLAQISLYLAQIEFKQQYARSVLFDTPNLFDKSISLDIINYLSFPNLINTCCSPYLGVKYRVISKQESIDINYFLNEFNPITGYPFKFKQIIKWPYLNLKQPDTNLTSASIMNKIYSNLTYLLTNLKQQELIPFEYDFKQQDYHLKEVNLNEDILIDKQETSLDKILFNLYHYPNKLDSIKKKFTRDLLINLRKQYQIVNDSIIISKTTTIDRIKSRLKRIQLIDKFNVKKLMINLQVASSFAPNLNFYFTGRDKELKQLKEMISLNKYVYIQGESGSGKTTLARKFIQLIESNYMIIWLNPNTLIQSFVRLAKEFCIQIDYRLNSSNYFLKWFQKIKIELNKFTLVNNLKVMFVIDDLMYIKQDDYLNDFKYLTYGFNSNIKFLITSIKVNRSLNTNESACLTLGHFNGDDCLEFIDKKLKTNKFTSQQVLKLINNHLPIKLEKQLAKINNNNECSQTQMESYESIEKENKKAFELLTYMSYLDNNQINFKFLKILFKNRQLKQNLKYLLKNCEIKQHKYGYYSLNRLTQKEVLKNYLLKENKEKLILNRICCVLNTKLNDFNTPEMTEELFRHSTKILKFDWINKLENKNYIELKIKTAQMFQQLNKNHVSLNIYKEIISYKSKCFYLNLALTYFNLGQLFYNQNECLIALSYYEQAFNYHIKKSDSQTNNINLSDLYFKMGLAYDDLSQFDKAIHFYEKSLGKFKLSNQNDKATSMLINNIGLIYSSQFQFDKALNCFETNLNSNKIDDLNKAVCLTNIGGVFYNQTNYVKAMEYFNRALTIQLDKLAFNDLNIALSYNNIGGCLDSLGKFREALEYFTKAFNLEKDALNHLNMATCLNNLSGVYLNLNDYDKAFEYNNYCLVIRRDYLELNHFDIGICLKNKAGIYQCLQQNEQALEYLLQVEKIETKTNFNRVDYAITCSNMSSIYLNLNEYSLAKDYINRSFDILNDLFDLNNHCYLGYLYNNNGLMCKKMENYEKAFLFFEKAHLSFEKQNNHLNRVIILNNIGCVYVAKKEFKKAMNKLENALNIGRTSLDYDNSMINLIYKNIVHAYDLLKDKKTH